MGQKEHFKAIIRIIVLDLDDSVVLDELCAGPDHLSNNIPYFDDPLIGRYTERQEGMGASRQEAARMKVCKSHRA